MLFMVMERFRDANLIAERLARHGRMLPKGVIYHASWINHRGDRCFQLMEAASQEDLAQWTSRWDDVIDFEIFPVLTSADYWAAAGRD